VVTLVVGDSGYEKYTFWYKRLIT